MKATGKITRPMAGEGSSIPTAMSTKESGGMTRPTAKESTTTMTAPATTVSGSKTFNKALASKNGLMDLLIKGNSCVYFKATS
jgi:hypothetical protein